MEDVFEINVVWRITLHIPDKHGHDHAWGNPNLDARGVWWARLFAQGLMPRLCDVYAERGDAVQDGHADLALGALTVEVPRDPALAKPIDTEPLGFGIASAEISASSSPDRPAEAPCAALHRIGPKHPPQIGQRIDAVALHAAPCAGITASLTILYPINVQKIPLLRNSGASGFYPHHPR